MKTISHILISHALFLVLFGGAALALAEEDAPVNLQQRLEERQENFAEQQQERRAEFEAIQAERQANMEERHEEMVQNMEERRAQLQERAQERITNLAANISNRVDSAIARIQNIIDRLETRIAKLSEQGVDTTEAENALASAQLSVDAAAAAMVDIDAQVADAVSSEDARTAWQGVRDIFLEVKNHLKTAHTELRATVAALKEAIRETEGFSGVSGAVQNENADQDEDEEPEGDSGEETE